MAVIEGDVAPVALPMVYEKVSLQVMIRLMLVPTTGIDKAQTNGSPAVNHWPGFVAMESFTVIGFPGQAREPGAATVELAPLLRPRSRRAPPTPGWASAAAAAALQIALLHSTVSRRAPTTEERVRTMSIQVELERCVVGHGPWYGALACRTATYRAGQSARCNRCFGGFSRLSHVPRNVPMPTSRRVVSRE